jgi:hypothetical protein
MLQVTITSISEIEYECDDDETAFAVDLIVDGQTCRAIYRVSGPDKLGIFCLNVDKAFRILFQEQYNICRSLAKWVVDYYLKKGLMFPINFEVLRVNEPIY